MGLQPISELSTADIDGGRAQVCCQRVPDGGSCDIETPPAELCPGPRNHRVMTFNPSSNTSSGNIG